MTTVRLYPAAILAASIGALTAAYVAQYGFGLQPCVLCLWQRVPYAAAAGLAVLALLAPRPRPRAALIGLAAVAFLINAGIAGFHVGVERHWWAGTAECAGGGPGVAAMTVEEMQAMMSRPAEARCDEPAWSFHGVTFAVLNVPTSLALAAFAGWAAMATVRRPRKEEP